MLLASGLTVAFLLAGLSAWQLAARHRGADVHGQAAHRRDAWRALLIPLQIVVGDLHGLNTLEHQPAKIAAMEGIWQTQRGAPLLLFACRMKPPQQPLRDRRSPRLASLILTHDLERRDPRLDEFLRRQHPPVAPVFWAFRVMVGTGLLMLACRGWRPGQLRRGAASPAALAAVACWSRMTFSGWVATLAGWYTTEIGRQPWLVHGVLRTARPPPVPAPQHRADAGAVPAPVRAAAGGLCQRVVPPGREAGRPACAAGRPVTAQPGVAHA
jgi:cytochrome d ubiquinol oxidase subunit I